MQDPYETLGVKRDASQDEIKRAYRGLARKLHPDLNPGDAAVEERFKRVSTAYDILGDPEKRKRFDRGEIDANGTERAPFGHGGGGFGGFGDADIFEEFFGRGPGGRRRTRVKVKGPNINYKLHLDFVDAVLGAHREISLANGKKLNVRIPPGTEDGQVLRLQGQGMQGMGGGPAGDALIEILVDPHPHFRRDGLDLKIEIPVSLAEAILGARIAIPTIDGKVTMALPKGANTGTVLRLRGKGIAQGTKRGDQYVTLKVMLPEPDDELTDFIRRWSEGKTFDGRRKAGLE